MDLTIRSARLDDAEDVGAFTEDTWPEHGGDYVPRVFESWVREDGPDARTLVAELEGRAVGLHRTVLLSADEGWCGGMRVDPEYEGEGIAAGLSRAAFGWARERGATVARAMVFSWNAAGLGAARAVGFEPAAEFRWAHPEPGGSREGQDDTDGGADPDDAWSFWQGSETLEDLSGLALDPNEPWALSSLTRERIVDAADEGRLLVVGDRGGVHGVEVGGVRGFAVRVRASEREADDGGDPERWAEYGVADWRDAEAASDLFAAIARDAAAVDADRTRVLIPETARAVSDAAVARVEVTQSPDFVLAADLIARE